MVGMSVSQRALVLLCVHVYEQTWKELTASAPKAQNYAQCVGKCILLLPLPTLPELYNLTYPSVETLATKLIPLSSTISGTAQLATETNNKLLRRKMSFKGAC